jgi:hypothetical protein
MAKGLSTYAQFIREGERFAQGIATNAEELPHLEMFRDQLNGFLEAVRDLTVRQGVAAAEKQELTRQLQDAFKGGTQLMTFLRRGVQQTYGTRSEKLVEFGLLPLRDRARRTVQPTPPATPTPPPPTIE